MSRDDAQTPPRDDDPVRIVPCDPGWPARFAAEAQTLHATIGPWITGGIHHIGSTAVPGLAAKSIIDIAVGVADLKSSRPCIELLADVDYLYAPYRTETRHWFCKPHPSRRTHHLHLVPAGSPDLADALAFRDYLRTHAGVAGEYAALKRELAGRHQYDRDAYTAGKSDLVVRLTRSAHAWRESLRQRGCGGRCG